MTAILLACLAGFFLGVTSVGTRLALRRAPSLLAGAFVANLGAFALVAIVALISGVSRSDFEVDTLWPFLVIGAVIPGTTQMLYVRAVRDAGAARTQVVMAIAPLFAALLAVGLLDEEWGPLLIVGTLLVVVGGMALAWDRSRPVGFRAAGIVIAIALAIAMASRDTATRWALSETDASVLVETAAVLLAAAVMAIVWPAILVRSRPDWQALRSAMVPFGLVAVLIGFGYIATFGAFERGTVTLIAPLIGTHALWSVVVANAVLGHTEAIGRRLMAASLLIVAGAALISVVRGEDGRVTVEEAQAALANAPPGADVSTAGPARGVYVYRTEGSEEIDALLSPSHTYPGDTVLTVAGSLCGWTERWEPLEGRSTERELCASDEGLRLAGYREIHTFLANTDARDYVCDTSAVLLSPAARDGETRTFTCDAGHTAETWTGGVVALEDDPIAAPARVLYLRFETVLSGRTSGTSVKELWLRESDFLVIRERVVNESATGTAIGDVAYAERYVLELTTPTPAG